MWISFVAIAIIMRRLLVLLVTSVMISACEPVSSEIGSDFFTDGTLDFSYIDSSTVNLSTIQLEEMATSGTSRLLVGTHHDHRLGKITATPFFQLSAADDVNFKDENVVYDYLSLLLPLDHYAYYDTLLPLTLSVHRVMEDIETEKGYLYNATTFQIETESLGSITLKPRPHNDSIEIKLSDVLGTEIFQKALDGGNELSATNFRKFFHGLAVLPDTANPASILGLNTNPRLKLHYLDKSTTPVSEKYVIFDVQNASNLYFTNVTCDRTSTRLETMPATTGRLSAPQTNDEAYLQAGAGLSLRIDLPHLRSLKQLTNFYPTRAILEIYPVRKSYTASTKLPAQLKVFKADKRNTIYNEIEIPAYLIEDVDLGRDTHYSFDATEFVKEQMELQSLNENALIFTTDESTYPVSVERIYAAAPGYEYKTRLRIYFATVNN